MPESEINGEVAIVYIRRRVKGRHGGFTLAKPELVSIGGRRFIAGSLIAGTRGHWGAGRRWYVSVDEVESIVEFATKEAYDEMLKAHPRRRGWRFSR